MCPRVPKGAEALLVKLLCSAPCGAMESGAVESSLSALLPQSAGFPFLRELIELAGKLLEGIVEGKRNLRRARNFVAAEEAAVAIQVGENCLGLACGYNTGGRRC